MAAQPVYQTPCPTRYPVLCHVGCQVVLSNINEANGSLHDRNFLYAIVTQGLFSLTINQTLGLVLTSTLDILMFTLNPRFILSIRELYAHTSRVQGVDTGFGMLSGHDSTTLSNLDTMPRFADARLSDELDEIEQVPLGEMRRKRYVDGP